MLLLAVRQVHRAVTAVIKSNLPDLLRENDASCAGLGVGLLLESCQGMSRKAASPVLISPLVKVSHEASPADDCGRIGGRCVLC